MLYAVPIRPISEAMEQHGNFMRDISDFLMLTKDFNNAVFRNGLRLLAAGRWGLTTSFLAAGFITDRFLTAGF